MGKYSCLMAWVPQHTNMWAIPKIIFPNLHPGWYIYWGNLWTCRFLAGTKHRGLISIWRKQLWRTWTREMLKAHQSSGISSPLFRQSLIDTGGLAEGLRTIAPLFHCFMNQDVCQPGRELGSPPNFNSHSLVLSARQCLRCWETCERLFSFSTDQRTL